MTIYQRYINFAKDSFYCFEFFYNIYLAKNFFFISTSTGWEAINNSSKRQNIACLNIFTTVDNKFSGQSSGWSQSKSSPIKHSNYCFHLHIWICNLIAIVVFATALFYSRSALSMRRARSRLRSPTCSQVRSASTGRLVIYHEWYSPEN